MVFLVLNIKNETEIVPNGHVAHETDEPVPQKIKVDERIQTNTTPSV